MRSTNRLIAAVAVVILLLLNCTQALLAQGDSRQQRRQFVEGLLQTLIESQLNRDPRQPPRPNQPPPQTGMVEARRQLTEFSTHSTQLVHHLDDRAARSPGARPLLGDALKLNASLSHLNARAATARRLEDLQPDFRALDRDWRVLSYRLRQAEGLGDDCLRCVTRLNELDGSLCEVLGVSPQVDSRELLTVSAAVNTSLAHLIEDIEIELPRTRRGSLLRVEAGQVQQRSIWFGRAISERRDHQALVAQFQAFHDSWRALAAKIRAVGHRHLDRNVRRIDESVYLLHELLWIPQPVNYAQLTYLTDRLTADVDRLFDEVSLNMLLEVPRVERVLAPAGEFYGLCQNFANSVATQAPLEQLRSDYRFLVEAWPELTGHFSVFKRPAVIHSLRAIEESFVALRDTIGLRPSVDWRRGTEIAAALSVLAGRLTVDVQRRVFSNSNYEQQFRVASARHASGFQGASRRLHESLVRRDAAAIGQHCERLATAWSKLTEDCFQQLNDAERQHFADARLQITQQVVQLQTMLQL